MIFAYSTNAFKTYSVIESLELIKEIGFDGVEIMCDRPHVYPPDFDEENLNEIKQTAEKLDLSITNLNCFTLFAVGDTYLPSWIEPEQPRRQIRIDHTLACLRVAKYLGCKNISIPPGGPVVRGDEQSSLSLFHKGLECVIPLAEELDVVLLIEPEPELLIENSRQIKSFIRDIASKHVGINFDVGHFYCVSENPEQALESLFEHIGHIHIEDIADSKKHYHLIPGLGAIDFNAFFNQLQKLRYQKDICLELYPYIDTPKEAGIQSYNYLTPIMKEYGFFE